MEKGITKHPPHFCGSVMEPTALLRVWHSFYLGGGYTRSAFEGSGPWEDDTNDQAAAEGIVGSATGNTHMRQTGWFVKGRKVFRSDHRTQFFAEGGGGRGTVKVGFKGTFNGEDAYGDIITEPNVADEVVQGIPIVIGGAGIMRRVPGGALVFGYQCNTGSNTFVYGFRKDFGGAGRR